MAAVNTDNDFLKQLGLSPIQSDKKVNDASELGIDAFLKLMVTQLSNQDPFEPMDNTQFVSQMAQFASVTGLDKLNESFDSFSASMTSDQALQAGSLIGRDVLVPSDQGYLATGGAIRGQVELDQSAKVVLRVTDAVGQLVREVSLGQQQAGPVHFSWDGITNEGEYAPSGNYNIQVEARYSGQSVSLQSQLFAPVESVSLGSSGQGLTLNLEGLGPVAFNQVKQIN
ncbi:MAG: flagellar hook assembly protein FlgD [Candidatus Sedimenticola sp. PURPLELP]